MPKNTKDAIQAAMRNLIAVRQAWTNEQARELVSIPEVSATLTKTLLFIVEQPELLPNILVSLLTIGIDIGAQIGPTAEEDRLDAALLRAATNGRIN